MNAPAARVVGIGVTPSGWPSMLALAHGLDRDAALGYVVVHRQAGATDDELVAQLRASTKLGVALIGEGDVVRSGVIHVTPSGREVEIKERTLHIDLPVAINEPMPIDRFLRSLSEALERDAVGVIVGTDGLDGPLGLRRIKELGGLTVVEGVDPAVGGTPHASAGLVDLVAPIDRMARRIGELTGGPGGGLVPPTAPDDGGLQDDAAAALRDILTLVRVRLGHDFSQYKRATLHRRIARRMQVCQTEEIGDYVRLLREHPLELTCLLRDFLISVTNFFRDPATFAVLDEVVFPKLFEGRDHSSHVRIWVPGCATGEEAYSLAILAAEHASRLEDQPQVQIFATDIDEQALAEARGGRYPATVAGDISAPRIERFFTRETGHLRVKKEIREMVLFSPHNLLRDPPFSKLDLVSCRNLLIYLNREAQERVFGILHFALRSEGVLVLGASESAEGTGSLFAASHSRHRIYTRRPASTAVQVASFFPSKWPHAGVAPAGLDAVERKGSVGDLHHKIVELYAPPSILVNEDLDLVHVSEHAGRYLVLSGGEPTRDLLRLIHPDLRLDLRGAIHASKQSGLPSDARPVAIDLDGESVQIQMRVRALMAPAAASGMLLVTFTDLGRGEPAERMAPDRQPEPAVDQLEDELQRTRDQLRSTVEQYETSVEELKASNEELHAINEELRSATEELETSKEELQSVNEELTTLNHELKDKIDEVSRANGDLQNLMTSTDIGVVFLDRQLNIKRFTTRVLDLFNVIPTDIGRPLGHVTHRLEVDDLVEHASTVLRTLRVVEQKVRGKDGRHYLLRMHPYRTVDDRIEGVVLTFLDVTQVQHVEEALRGRDALLRLAEQAAEAGSWEVDVTTGGLHVSVEGCRLLGLDPEATLTLSDWIARVEPRDQDRVEKALRRAAELREDLDLEVRIEHPTAGARWLWALGRGNGDTPAVTGLIVDITARRRAETELRRSEERFRLALRSAPLVILTQDRDLRYDWGHLQGGEIDFIGKLDEDLFAPDEAAQLTAIKRRVLDTGLARREELKLTFGGRTRYYDYTVEAVREEGVIVGLRIAAVDVTGSKLAELELREADRRKDEFLATLAHELRNPLTPIRAALDVQALANGDLPRIMRARDVMDRQLGQLVHLVDDLLDVARISRGTIQLRRERVVLSTVIEAAVESTAAAVAEAGHTLVVEPCDEPLVLYADPTRLTQAITNLLTNAVRYSPDPSTIRLSCARDGDAVVLRVRDQGMGIAAEDLPRVFDLFHRTRAAMDTRPGGLGIGLHLVQRLVELHGGTIEIHSAGPGTGTEVAIHLPLGQLPAETPRRGAGLPVRRRDVLVVDDNRDVAGTVGEMLELLGHEVRLAFDGASALRAIEERCPDLVLLDLGLPDVDGYEVARRIRARPDGRDLRIVALSGWGGTANIERSRAAGVDRHLVKPAGLAELRDVVGEGH